MTRRYATPSRIAFALAVFLGSLTLVTWRQGRAYTVMSEVDSLHAAISLERAEGAELRQRIQRYESLAWVTEQARERLGMHQPEGEEIRLLRGGDR